MPLKMSLINKELILQILRSVGWVSIVYFLGLFFVVPLQVIMLVTNDQIEYNRFDTLFRLQFEIQSGFIIIIPVLLAVFLYRFLQTKQSTDLMHSLPIKREKIFHHYTLTGILLLILPIVLNMGIMLILKDTMNLQKYFSSSDVFRWTGETMVLVLFIFISGVFIAMITGISAVQGVLTYICLLLPAGAFVLVIVNLRFLFYGFPMEYFMNQEFQRWSPLILSVYLTEYRISGITAAIFALMSVLLYIVSLAVYKRRKMESATQAIAFPKLEYVFKYGATFFMMLLVGMYFDISQQKTGWTIFGYTFGSLLGYYLSEMVLQKTWRVFRIRKGLVIYAATIGMLIVCLQIGLNGYEKKVPDLQDIENVLMTSDTSVFVNHVDMYFKPTPLKEKQNIQAVREFHKKIASDQNTSSKESSKLILIYKLKDGSQLVRDYTINSQVYKEYLKAVYETDEYKMNTNELFSVEKNKISKIMVNPKGPFTEGTRIFDTMDVEGALDALQKDVMNESYEEMIESKGVISGIDIELETKHTIYVPLKASYANFKNWLDRKGLLEQATMTSKDVDYAKIIPKEQLDGLEYWENKEVLKIIQNSSSVVTITKSEEIDELIDGSIDDPKGEYVVVFFLKKGNEMVINMLEEKDLPENVIKQF